jgi:hypothetical protein
VFSSGYTTSSDPDIGRVGEFSRGTSRIAGVAEPGARGGTSFIFYLKGKEVWPSARAWVYGEQRS